MRVKLKIGNEFKDAGVIFGQTKDQVEAVNSAGEAALNEIETKRQEVINSIPDYEDTLNTLQNGVNDRYTKSEIDTKITEINNSIPDAYDDTELKEGFTQLENKKVGYSEVVNGQLLMYSDDTKEHLLATLELPVGQSTDVQIDGTSVVENGVANIPISTKNHDENKYLIPRFNSGYGITTRVDGYAIVQSATDADINNRSSSYRPIVPSNLEKAVTSVIDFKTGGNPQRKHIVEESDLAEYVKNTDYATASKVGAVKLGGGTALYTDASGNLRASILSLSEFQTYGDYCFLTTGTINCVKEHLVKSVIEPTKIYDVTLEEDVSSISFTTNKFYNHFKIYARIKATKQVWSTIRFNNSSDNYFVLTGAGDMYYFGEFEILDGAVYSIIANGGVNDGLATIRRQARYYAQGSTPTNYILIGTSTPFLTGSEIKIYAW